MPFTENNNMSGYRNNSQNGQDNEKQSISVGKIYGKSGEDTSKSATLAVGIYATKYSMFATLSVRYEIGRLSNGQTQFEGGLNKDIPSVLLNIEDTLGLIKILEFVDEEGCDGISFVHDTGKSSIAFEGSKDFAKITIKNPVGSKTIQFNAKMTNAKVFNIPGLKQLQEYLKIISKKQINRKIEPEDSNETDSSSPFA